MEDVEDMDISVDDEVDSPAPGLKLKIKIADNSPEKPYVTFSVTDFIFKQNDPICRYL